jgi:hypothetical protein
MQLQTPLQGCSRPDLGLRVVPDASQMCAVSLHAGASSRSISALYDWNFLAAAPCVLISMSNAYCYEVSKYGLMVVGHGVVKTVSPITGSMRRRRLLSVDDAYTAQSKDGNGDLSHYEGVMLDIKSFYSWDHASEPCRMLVHAFVKGHDHNSTSSKNSTDGASVVGGMAMGVLDMYKLDECIHWRKVGRSIVQDLNMTSMAQAASPVHDCCSHAFMSANDFLSVLSSNKGVGLQLLEKFPDVVKYLFVNTDSFSAFYSIYNVWKQHAVLYYLESLWKDVLNATGSTNGTATAQHGWLLSASNSTEIITMRKFMREHKRQVALFQSYANEPFVAMFENFSSSNDHQPHTSPDPGNFTSAEAASHKAAEDIKSVLEDLAVLMELSGSESSGVVETETADENRTDASNGTGISSIDNDTYSTRRAMAVRMASSIAADAMRHRANRSPIIPRKQREHATRSTGGAPPEKLQGSKARQIFERVEGGIMKNGAQRKLLQGSDGGSMSWTSSSSGDQTVDSYSSLVASTKGFSNIAVSSMRKDASLPLVTETWLQGPFGWPPRYKASANNENCLAFEVSVKSAVDVFRVLKQYYDTDFARKVKSAPWDVQSNMPSLYSYATSSSSYSQQGQSTSTSSNSAGNSSSNANATASPSGEISIMSSYWDVTFLDQDNWAPYFFSSVLGSIHTYLPWMETAVAGFLTLKRGPDVPKDALTAGNIVHDLVVCEFDSVMFCRKHDSKGGRTRRNLLICMVISFGMWYALGLLASTIPGVGTMLNVLIFSFMWMLVPTTGVQLTYGMAVTCFPMIPTCALQDTIVALQGLLPITLALPSALQRYPGCLEQMRIANNGTASERQQECMRSCRDEPFYFRRWEDSAAWMLCSFTGELNCTSISVPYAPMVQQAAWNYSSVIAAGTAPYGNASSSSQDLLHAHQFCFWVTLGQALPWFFIMAMGVVVLLNMIKLPFVILLAAWQFLVQALSYTHVE